MTRARSIVADTVGYILMMGLSVFAFIIAADLWIKIVSVSIWLGVSSFSAFRAWRWYRLWIWHDRRRLGHCVNCGYDLRGSVGRCPECGYLDERRDWSEL